MNKEELIKELMVMREKLIKHNDSTMNHRYGNDWKAWNNPADGIEYALTLLGKKFR